MNPILSDLAKQLPDTAQTSSLINECKNYKEIAIQARSEMVWLKKYDFWTDEGQEIKRSLTENGYEQWLRDCEEDDRLRLIGVLELIFELCEELEEEEY